MKMTIGTSRFEQNQLTLETIDLQPPLDKIMRSELAKLRVSQY